MDCNPIPKDLASEPLSAEAWNTLMEYAPHLVRAAAEGMGVSLGATRQMAAEGRITAEVLVVAFQKKAQDLQQEDRDRMAEIDAKAMAYRFSHEDVLRALDAAAMPKFAAGDMLTQVHPGEAIVPKTCTLRIGGAAGGGGGICGGGQPPAFNPWPEMLAASREILRLNTQIASILQRWDGDGIPSQRA